MALSLSEIQSLTIDVWMPGAYKTWQMGNIMMFKMLDAAEPKPSGEYVRYPLVYARSNGGAFGPTTIFNTTKKAIANAARFPWAYFYGNTTWDIEDDVKVNGGANEVDLLMVKLDNMQSSLKDYMGDSIWTAYATSVATYGAATVPFYGIPDLFAASSALGSIAAADLGTFINAGSGSSQNIWAPYTNSDALTMSFNTLQLLSRSTKVGDDNSKQVIDLIVTTATLKDSYEAGLQAQQRTYDADLMKAGFDHVNFRTSCPVVSDDKATASSVQGFNMKNYTLHPHQDYNFTKPEWMSPTNQPQIKTCSTMFVGAIGTGARRSHGQMTNVSA
jgi:hypothetical protein